MFSISTLGIISIPLFFFLLPISTAGANIAFYGGVFFAFLCCLSNTDREKLIGLKRQPFLTFFLFFCLIFLSAVLITDLSKGSLAKWFSYREIFFMPLLALLVATRKNMNRLALNGFLIAVGLTLLLSYCRSFFNVSIFDSFGVAALLPKLGDQANPTIFKWHITHNFFMAFAVLLWGYLAICFWRSCRSLSIGLGFLSLLGLINIFFMVQGRTGYLVIFSALLYAFVARCKLKGFLFGAVIVCVVSLFLYGFSINFKNRIDLGIFEVLNWSSTSPSNTSMGLRLEFIYQSLKIVSEHLFFGVGVGNFGSAYGTSTLDLGMAQSVNPHNQYVLFLVETGLIGLGAFLYLNFICWKCAGQLSLFWMHATRIVILSYGVANLFNSFLFDFSERLFFSGFMALAFSELLQKKNKVNSVT